MLATRFAADHPHRVGALITLASNARFIATRDWPAAMDIGTFQTFYRRMTRDRNRGLKRFCQLVSHGDKHSDRQWPWLEQNLNHCGDQELLLGLQLLAELDNCQHLGQLQCPSLHLLGAEDTLVPAVVARPLSRLTSDMGIVRVLANQGHLLHYPENTAMTHFNSFVSELIDDR